MFSCSLPFPKVSGKNIYYYRQKPGETSLVSHMTLIQFFQNQTTEMLKFSQFAFLRACDTYIYLSYELYQILRVFVHNNKVFLPETEKW